ncbi:MAG: hypothetical protein LC733_00370 [Actinobacteria bacterium]|nr:hypothetical protein [Actinomycetota bacterium]
MCVLLAIFVLVQFGGRRASEPAPMTVAANTSTPPGPISVSGPGDISVARQVYEPGQDSGWHTHPGIHAVAVLSGTLTVYDSECRAQTFEAGRPYIGGQELHLARNETAVPVEMSVTYVSPSAPTTPSRHLPAPTGCEVAR